MHVVRTRIPLVTLMCLPHCASATIGHNNVPFAGEGLTTIIARNQNGCLVYNLPCNRKKEASDAQNLSKEGERLFSRNIRNINMAMAIQYTSNGLSTDLVVHQLIFFPVALASIPLP